MARTALFFGKQTRCALAGMVLAMSGCSAPVEAPERDKPTFVSLNPCLDAILVEVAEPDQILALSHYSRDPSASSMDTDLAKQFGVTGGTVEEILALQPDIVLGSTFMSPATRNALARLGLQVEAFGSPASVDESIQQVERLRTLVGEDADGGALIAGMRPAQPAQSGATAPSALLWQPGEIVPGSQTLIAQLITEAGFSNHAEALGLGQADRITLEQVLASPPDLLLVAGTSRGQRHPALDVLDGVAVETFDQRLLYCGGPTVTKARDRLMQIRRELESPAS